MGKTYLTITSKWRLFYTKLLIAALALTVVTTFVYYHYSRRADKAQFKHWLSQTVANRTARMTELFQDYISHAEILSKNSTVIDAFGWLKDHPKDEQYVKELSNFFNENSSFEQNIHNTILILIDGSIIFSDLSSEYVGRNILNDELLKTSALSKSFERVTMGLTLDVSDFLYDPLLKVPALFVAVPVFHEQKLIGVFVSQISTNAIFHIMDEYVGFGKTGDIVFGDPQEAGILLVSNSRIDDTKPLKKFIPYKHVIASTLDFPLARGAEGETGSGTLTNYDGTETIAAWTYIPKVEWGVAAFQAVWEFEQRFKPLKLFMVLLLVLLLVAFLVLIKESDYARGLLKNHFHTLLFILSAALFAVVIFKSFSLIRNMNSGLQETKKQTEKRIKLIGEEIDRYIQSYEAVGETLVRDLESGYLPKEDLIKRIKQDLKEYPTLSQITVAFEPYQFDKNKKLYAPNARRKGSGVEVIQAEETYDYLAEAEHVADVLDPSSWAWYTGAIKSQKKIWFDPYVDTDGILVAGYSIPFYQHNEQGKKVVQGVVNVIVLCEPILKLLKELEIGKDGYSMLITSKGNLIYHPRYQQTTKNNNLLYQRAPSVLYNLAQEQGNEELFNVTNALLKGKTGFSSYTDMETGQKMWLYTTHIAATHWILNGVFSSQEGALLKLVIRQYGIDLLSLFLLLCLTILTYVASTYQFKRFIIAASLTVTFLLFIMAALLLIWFTPTFDVDHGTILIDQNRLSRYLQVQDIYNQTINEPQIKKIPTGLDIVSVYFPTTNTVAVSGYLWQKYSSDTDPALIREPHFETINLAEFRKLYQVTQKDERQQAETVVGWEFNAKFDQKFHYDQYPFDSIVITLGMEYPNFSSPILLVPDLMAYRNIKPDRLPGLEGINLSGFRKYKTLYAFNKYSHEQTFGLDAWKRVPESTYLTYNLMLKRDLLFDFVVFFLPILIIFFLLYAIFVIEGLEELSGLFLFALSAYAGLAFAVMLLHRSVRERIQTSDVLYLEYLFFMIYITFAVLVIYTVLRAFTDRITPTIHTIFAWFRIFFWPVQLAVFYLITIFVFYGS